MSPEKSFHSVQVTCDKIYIRVDPCGLRLPKIFATPLVCIVIALYFANLIYL